ncbi:hypothetical protein Peur_031388 [Populus x canadensis]
MLTGDTEAAAMYAQEQANHAPEVVHAELLPEGKATIIKELKKEGPAAKTGDDLNDAPALAIADIGISMGISRSALAIDTGHVILMFNDLRKVPKAIRLARKAPRKVIENVIMSMSTKSAILALAFAGHPLVWAAVLADLGTCLLVIFSSMLLLRGTQHHAGKCTKTSGALRSHKHGNKNSSHNNHSDCCSMKKVEKLRRCRVGLKIQAVPQGVALPLKLRRCQVELKCQSAPQGDALARKLRKRISYKITFQNYRELKR